MPIARCTKNGKKGWKAWKGSKHCYTGKDAKAKAKKQLRAIEISKHRRKMGLSDV